MGAVQVKVIHTFREWNTLALDNEVIKEQWKKNNNFTDLLAKVRKLINLFKEGNTIADALANKVIEEQSEKE